jgi:hypothetical protein
LDLTHQNPPWTPIGQTRISMYIVQVPKILFTIAHNLRRVDRTADARLAVYRLQQIEVPQFFGSFHGGAMGSIVPSITTN